MSKWLNNLSARFVLFAIALVLASGAGLEAKAAAADVIFHVGPNGRDTNQGTKKRPFETLARAKEAVKDARQRGKKPITVQVGEGTYYQAQPLTFGPADSGTRNAPVTWLAEPGKVVTISGGRKLRCRWKRHKKGIMKCELGDVKAGKGDFTQLFVNGRRQHRARFPNYDNTEPGQTGYIRPKGRIPPGAVDPMPDDNQDMTQNNAVPRGIVFKPETFTKNRWARPEEAIIHIFQGHHWGNLQWIVKAVDFDNHYVWFGEGGQQVGAKWFANPISVDDGSQFYIENVFEELDAPGEWYLDKSKGILYYMPADDVDLDDALVEVPVLQQLIRFAADQYDPTGHITFDGFRIAHTESTFLEKYWIPSGSDWSIHRGGTVFMEGARDCTIKNCWFDAVGGNAVFMNNYNRDNLVTGCKFTEAGDSAVCFVGTLEFTNGSYKSFPFQCEANNNLIHDCGIFGKQVAGVYISRAKRITASHNLIYNMPRAGICIGDGSWGGHLIEFNHVHNVIRETWDHGPFNSWGREAFWCLTHSHGDTDHTDAHPAGRVKIWAMEPTIIRNNYWHGNVGYEGGYRQGIDIDDGSSNYHIYNNVCRDMAISIREGDYRTVENNIIIRPVVPFGVHVGHVGNHDIIRRNIFVTDNDAYYMNDAPPGHPVVSELNNNLYFQPTPGWGDRTVITVNHRGKPVSKYTFGDWQELGYDVDSVVDDPLFVDMDNDDFQLKPDSPALKLGFKNIDQSWGITDEFPEMWREGEKF